MFLISLVNVFSKKTEINVYFMSTISFIVKLIIQICLYKAADGGGEKTVVVLKRKCWELFVHRNCLFILYTEQKAEDSIFLKKILKKRH